MYFTDLYSVKIHIKLYLYDQNTLNFNFHILNNKSIEAKDPIDPFTVD